MAKGKLGQTFYPLDYMSAEDRFRIIREKYPFAYSRGAIPTYKTWEGMTRREQKIAEQRAMKLMEHEAVSRALPCPHCGWARVKISRHRASGPDYEAGRKLIRLMCKECGCSTNYEKTLWEAECKWNRRYGGKARNIARTDIMGRVAKIGVNIVEQLRKENEALRVALKDAEVRGISICRHCEHGKPTPCGPCEELDYDCINCKAECICRKCIDGSEWKLRGIQAEKPANVCG